MPRIVGVDIPDNKKIKYALTSIYGVGLKTAEDIMSQARIDESKRAKELTLDEINRIQRILDNYIIEGKLRKYISENIQRLKRINTYRGLRHKQNLPVRGQRTRTNARTKRSGRKTVGAMSKDLAAKLESQKKAKAA